MPQNFDEECEPLDGIKRCRAVVIERDDTGERRDRMREDETTCRAHVKPPKSFAAYLAIFASGVPPKRCEAPAEYVSTEGHGWCETHAREQARITFEQENLIGIMLAARGLMPATLDEGFTRWFRRRSTGRPARTGDPK